MRRCEPCGQLSEEAPGDQCSGGCEEQTAAAFQVKKGWFLEEVAKMILQQEPVGICPVSADAPARSCSDEE